MVPSNGFHANQRARTPEDPAEQNIRAVALLEARARLNRSPLGRVAEAITGYAGTAWSVILHALWFATWVIVNTGHTPWKPFDPFPFSLLTATVSLEAIFLTLFVLGSQNRLTREAQKRAHLDLQVNLLSEQEMTLVLRMLKELCDRFDLTHTTRSDEFRALIKRTDLGTLAERVEQKLTPQPDLPPRDEVTPPARHQDGQ